MSYEHGTLLDAAKAIASGIQKKYPTEGDRLRAELALWKDAAEWLAIHYMPENTYLYAGDGGGWTHFREEFANKRLNAALKSAKEKQ